MATSSQETTFATDSDSRSGRRCRLRVQVHLPASLCCPREERFEHAVERLKPAEDLIGAFALADSITFAADPTSWRPGVLGSSMRVSSMLREVFDELFGVLALTERFRSNSGASAPCEQLPDGTMLGPGRIREQDIDAQTVAIFDDRKPAIAQLDQLAVAFRHVDRMWIDRASMRCVRTLLTLELDLPRAVAAAFGRLHVLAFETLQRGLRFHRRAIDRQIIGRQQFFGPRYVHQSIEKAARDIACYQSLEKTAEIRVIKPGLLEGDVKKQANAAVVVELLVEPPIGANPIPRDQQLALEQKLRCARRASGVRVKRVQIGRNHTQSLVGQIIHPPRPIIRRYVLRRAVVEHRTSGASWRRIVAAQGLRRQIYDKDFHEPITDFCLTLLSRFDRGSLA